MFLYDQKEGNFLCIQKISYVPKNFGMAGGKSNILYAKPYLVVPIFFKDQGIYKK